MDTAGSESGAQALARRSLVAGGVALLLVTSSGAARAESEPAIRPPLTVPVLEPTTGVPAAAGPALVVTESVTLRVLELERATTRLVELAERAGGRLGSRTDTELVLRVPPDALPGLRRAFGELGVELAHSASAREVGDELARLEARALAAAAARDRVAALFGPHRSVDDGLTVTRAVSTAEAELGALAAERRRLLEDIAAATLTVRLVPAVPPIPETIPVVKLPFPWLERTHEGALSEPSSGDPPPRPRALESMIDGGFQLELSRLPDRPDVGDRAYSLGGALRMRGIPQAKPLGLAMGLDAAFGGGSGFAYELDFLLGLGGSFLPFMSIGLLSGAAGRSWAGGRIPAAWELPLELFTSIELGEWGRILLQARPMWLPSRIEARQDGSSLSFADELLLRATVMAAPLTGEDRLEEGALRLGIAWHQVMDVEMVTVTFGWGAGVAEHRTRY